jgi:hypothetical protein
MIQNQRRKHYLVPLVLSILMTGCDDRATKIAREAADRQAQQNTTMSELHKEVANGTRELIVATNELQSERKRLDTGWSALEAERQHISSERRTVSLWMPIAESLGAAGAVVVIVGFCWYVLVRTEQHVPTGLNEILVSELLSNEMVEITQCGRARPALDTPRKEQEGR